MKPPHHEELEELISTATAVAREVPAEFGSLSGEQLNWKPGPGRWSVAQCLDHLITANRAYFSTFDKALEGTLETTIWQRLPVLPTLWGALLRKAVSPQSPRRVKAPKVFQPAASDLDVTVLDRFADQQQRVIGYLEAVRDRGLDAASIIIPSPVASWLTYSLLDAFRIIVPHEQRHLIQAMLVMETKGFPR